MPTPTASPSVKIGTNLVATCSYTKIQNIGKKNEEIMGTTMSCLWQKMRLPGIGLPHADLTVHCGRRFFGCHSRVRLMAAIIALQSNHKFYF